MVLFAAKKYITFRGRRPRLIAGRKDRTAASAAAYSYLLVATDARSASRDRLRAMPCQKEENERSEVKSTKTIRMSLFAGTTSGPR